MNAFAHVDASSIRSVPGEQLLAFRVLLGRKVARLIDAELDRRATHATCPETAIEPAASRNSKHSRRQRAA